MNGDDNVIPMGPIPHEKPWYETDEGKKLIAKTSKSELISNNRYDPPCKSRPRFTFLSIIKLFLFWRFKNENIDIVKKIK